MQDFHDKLFKGNIFKELVKVLFEKSGYLVIPYGYETQLSSIRDKLAQIDNSVTALKIRSSPDLLVYDDENKDVKLVEVKMSSFKSPRITTRNVEIYRRFWDDAILVMVVPFENVFYAQEMHNLGIKEYYDPLADFLPIEHIFSRLDLDDLENYRDLACNLIASMRKKSSNEIENGF